MNFSNHSHQELRQLIQNNDSILRSYYKTMSKDSIQKIKDEIKAAQNELKTR